MNEIEQKETEKKVELQRKFCRDNKKPFFANNSYCYMCRHNFWTKISEEKASTTHITGCACCRMSFV